MEIKLLNGDISVPKILWGGGGNYPQDSRGVGNPNNPLIYATAITSVPLKTNISYEYFENFRFFSLKQTLHLGLFQHWFR